MLNFFSWRSSGFTVIFVAACWSDHTWLAEGWKKKGCKIAEFRCDATSDITINLHKRFLRKPSLDGDQDGFLERKWSFFGVCKKLKIGYFTYQIRNRMSGCSKLCLACTVCRYPKKNRPLRRFSSSLAIQNRPTKNQSRKVIQLYFPVIWLFVSDTSQPNS